MPTQPRRQTAASNDEHDGDISLADIRIRIVRAFERRARTEGIRAIKMGVLASQLGVSTRRLYECFPSKADIVGALMDQWASEWEEGQRAEFKRERDPVERLKERAGLHLKLNQRFSSAFWIELERDYPEAYQRFNAALDRILRRLRAWLSGRVRSDLSPDFATEMLIHFIGVCTRTHEPWPFSVSRTDALDAFIEIWAGGALRQNDQTPRQNRKQC